MLFQYMQRTQRLVGDTNQTQVPPNDIIDCINQARNHIAELTQSVRAITLISGSVTSITLLAGGSGYTSPTVTISTPDSPGGLATNPSGVQAAATAVLTGTSITSITLSVAGAGYFQPTVTITDSTGSGASATANVSALTQTVNGQEVYPFSNFVLTPASGVGAVFAVKSVSMIYDDFRYSLPVYSFSTYQALIRRYPRQYSYVPTIGSQFGQGTNGSLYLYPIANSNYQFECDCFCLPTPLAADTDPEVIPQPWSDSVPFFAAYLVLLQMQRANDARGMLDLFDKFLLRQSGAARSGRRTNPYGRWIVLLPLFMSVLPFISQVA